MQIALTRCSVAPRRTDPFTSTPTSSLSKTRSAGTGLRTTFGLTSLCRCLPEISYVGYALIRPTVESVGPLRTPTATVGHFPPAFLIGTEKFSAVHDEDEMGRDFVRISVMSNVDALLTVLCTLDGLPV